MQSAHELFLHELSDILDAEQNILETLSEQSEECENSSLEAAFLAHHKQTEGQIERLQQCFELLGEEAEETECAGIKGLREEHDNMKEEDPSPDILDVFNIGAGIKVERYEISAYESLIRLAEMMGHDKVARLLGQNMREEEQTLKKLQSLAEKVKPENMGMGEEEEQQGEVGEEVASASQSRSSGRKGPRMVKKSGGSKSSPRRRKAA